MTFKKYLLLLLCLPCFVQAKNITISRLTCEMQEGLVVVESCPRLGWAMESPENGTRQTAYEIEIREAFTGRSVWNSGKVTSSQSQLVPTEGADICLNNPFNYSWRVRVWDETDILPNGVRKQNSVWHPMTFLQGNGSAPSLVRILTFPKGESFMVAN